jgi:hypothetical protein
VLGYQGDLHSDAFLVTGKAIPAAAAGRILSEEAANEKVGHARTHAEDGVDVPAS